MGIAAYADPCLCYYLDDLRALPDLLTDEEVTRLGREAQSADMTVRRAARQELAERNLRLVLGVAQRFNHFQNVSLSDLVQQGNLGLLRAVETFNPRRGKFSTYATWWIRQFIQRYLQDHRYNIRIPVYLQDALRSQEAGRPITVNDEHLRQAESLTRGTVPLEQYISSEDGEDRKLMHCLTDPSQDTAEEATTRALVSTVSGCIDELYAKGTITERQVGALRTHFGLGDQKPHSFREVGQQWGISGQRVAAAGLQAMARLADHPAMQRLAQELGLGDGREIREKVQALNTKKNIRHTEARRRARRTA